MSKQGVYGFGVQGKPARALDETDTIAEEGTPAAGMRMPPPSAVTVIESSAAMLTSARSLVSRLVFSVWCLLLGV